VQVQSPGSWRDDDDDDVDAEEEARAGFGSEHSLQEEFRAKLTKLQEPHSQSPGFMRGLKDDCLELDATEKENSSEAPGISSEASFPTRATLHLKQALREAKLDAPQVHFQSPARGTYADIR
jgi:hypothetical protein